VTLILDCKEVGALLLNRTIGTSPSNTGVLLIGQQLLNDNAFFMGDIQQLFIIPGPEAAYEVCSKYMPNCNVPLPDFRGTVEGDENNNSPTFTEGEGPTYYQFRNQTLHVKLSF
jgi:hypothetical protein